MANIPVFLVVDATVTTRSAEVPDANFDNGCNVAASCAHGLGINYDGGAIVGTANQFTLLDQNGDARVPQTANLIGGNGLGDGVAGSLPDPAIRSGTPSTEGDGEVTPIANAVLNTLNEGWVAAV